MLRCVFVSLLATIAIPGYAFAQTAPSLNQSIPQAAKVLPADTAGVFLINTSEAGWKELSRFNPLPTGILPPIKLPLLPDEIDFGQDVQPWLGDRVAIALLPATSKADSFESNTIVLAPIKDTSSFSTFLAKLKATQGQPQIERDYKGVTILQWSLTSPAAKPSPEAVLPYERSRKPNRTVTQLQLSPTSNQSLHSSQVEREFLASAKAINPSGEESVPLVPLPSLPQPAEVGRPQVLAIALLPGNIAVATQSEALEKLIDTRSDRTTLLQNPLFQRTLNHPQFGRSLLVGYGDIANFARYLSNFYASAPVPLPLLLPPLGDTQISQVTKVYNTIDTHLWVQPEGVHGQTNFYYTTPQTTSATPTLPTSNQILARLPSATYLSANSRNFKQQWQSLAQTGQTDPVIREFLVGVRKATPSLMGLDLEKDVIPWMDGEYAFFLFPTTSGLFNYFSPNFNLGLGLTVQTSDRPAAEIALKKLDQFIRSTSRGEVKTVSRRIKGQPVISWESRDKDKIVSFLSHGWVDRDTLIITTGVGPMAALNPKPYLPLHLNYTFKAATDSLPTSNEGYFYINMGSSLALLYGLILPSVPRQYDPFVEQIQLVLGTLRSVSTTNSITAEAQRVDSLWVLGPVKQPK